MNQSDQNSTPTFYEGAYVFHPKTNTIGVVTVPKEISPDGLLRTRLRLATQIEMYFHTAQLQLASAEQIAEYLHQRG